MAVYIHKPIAVEMYQLTAAAAFQMKMLVTFLIVFDILIAGACFAVNYKFADSSRFNKAVELAVNSCQTDGRAD